MVFLIPIVVGAVAMANQDEAGTYTAGSGDRTIDAYEIWDRIAHGDGTGSIDASQEAAARLKDGYAERVGTIDQLAADMDAAWDGDAGEAAKAGANPLRDWLEDAGTKLADADRYLGEQHDAFATIYNKVREIPENPPESDFLNDITPWETDTDRAIQDYNEKAQANVDAFDDYHTASGENGDGMPSYRALESEFQDVAAVEQRTLDEDLRTEASGATTEDSGADGDAGSSGPGSSGQGSGDYRPGGTAPLTGRPGAGDSAGGYQPGGPGAEPPGPASRTGGPGAGTGPPTGTRPGLPESDGSTRQSGFAPDRAPAMSGPDGGFRPSGPGDAGFGPGGVGAGPGSGPGTGSGADAGGSATGFGPGGAGKATGSGAPAGAGAGSGRGTGGRGTGASEQTGKSGAAGMPMGGMGAGKGKGGEDEVHQTRFLVEENPNSLFGSDELTAPPVIGE